MDNTKSTKPLSGVHCVVTSCVYHSENNECHAGNITVGGHSAATKGETDCETFNKKECCN